MPGDLTQFPLFAVTEKTRTGTPKRALLKDPPMPGDLAQFFTER
jgi:hypothetical protein